MSAELTQALLADAPAESLLAAPAPTATRGLCVRREDESMFAGLSPREIDVRASLRLEEVPLPQLAPDEALVAMMASAINYNTVWTAMFRPVSTFRFLEAFAKASPVGARHAIDRHILGSDGAGVVVRTGSDVRHWRVGDHVIMHPLHTDEQDPRAQCDGMLPAEQRAWGFETNFGGLADFAVVKATQLLPKPGHLTWEEAACNALCLTTAYRMLISANGARVKLGDLVLIWGATGGLGSYATQLAKAAGCRVVGVVGSHAKAELASELGCDLVIDRSEIGAALDSSDGWRHIGKAIRECFGADPDCIFEHVGRETFGASVVLARRGGTIVTCGSSTGYEHVFDNRHLWMRLKRIVGSHGGNYQEAVEATQLLNHGIVVPSLSRVYPLEQAAEAAHSVHRNAHVGKIGVRCLAPSADSGVTDPERRARISETRLRLVRAFEERG